MYVSYRRRSSAEPLCMCKVRWRPYAHACMSFSCMCCVLLWHIHVRHCCTPTRCADSSTSNTFGTHVYECVGGAPLSHLATETGQTWGRKSQKKNSPPEGPVDCEPYAAINTGGEGVGPVSVRWLKKEEIKKCECLSVSSAAT